jgi:ketosteroid isomerase-like protein
MKYLFILLLALQTSLAQNAPVPATLDPTEAIKQLREGLINSFNKADIDALLTHLDTNVVVTWQNGEVSRGKDGVKAYYEKMMNGDRPVVRKVTANPEVEDRHVYDDWAVSWGNLHDRFLLTDGSDLSFNSRFTATIRRRGDQWVLSGFHASVNAFDNPVLHTAMKKVGIFAAIGGIVAGILAGVIVSGFLRRKTPSAA